MRRALAAALLLTAPTAAASTPGSDGLGFVAGTRVGAVHGTFDGTTAVEGASGWGPTFEIHTDLLKTFGHDRYAVGAALGYLWQSNLERDGETLALEPEAFEHTGVSLTGFVSAAIGARNSASVRLGVVSGDTTTAAGTIVATLYRVGVQATHVYSWAIFDFAVSAGLEYFTSADAMDRGYRATAITLDVTGALAF